MNSRNKKILLRRMEPWFLLAPALIAILAFMAYPIFDNIRISFLNYSLIHPKDIHFNGFDNYVKLFKSPDLGLVALNTFIWVISIVPLQAILGMALAQLLNRKFFGKGVFQSILFLPWVIAGFMTGLIFKWIFSEQSGILNYVLIQIGAINEPISWLADKSIAMIGPIMGMIWFGIPFFAIMFLAALKSIPQEIHESVMMDGAGPIKRFIFIDIPFIKPTIITTLLLRVIWVFNSSDVTFIMTGGGPGNSTSTLPLYAFRQAFATLDFGYAAAISNIITIVLVIYALFFLKVTKYQEAGDF